MFHQSVLYEDEACMWLLVYCVYTQNKKLENSQCQVGQICIRQDFRCREKDFSRLLIVRGHDPIIFRRNWRCNE